MKIDLNTYNLDTLQEMYALKFFTTYGVFPKSKHLETDKDLLIKKIKILSFLKKPSK